MTNRGPVPDSGGDLAGHHSAQHSPRWCVRCGQRRRSALDGLWHMESPQRRRAQGQIHPWGQQITIPARKRVGFSVGAVLSQAAEPRRVKATSTAKPGSPASAQKKR